MPVIITKEIKKKRMLLIAFAVLVLVSVAILYFGGVFESFTQPAPTAEQAQTQASAGMSAEPPISDAKLKILQDERFTNLQNSPGVPLKTDTTGKSNPFSD